MPPKRDREQRNPSAIILLQSKFPTPHMTVQTKSNIRVWCFPVLHWVLSSSPGGPFLFLCLRLQLLLMIVASLSSSLNRFWGLLSLNWVKVQHICVKLHSLWPKASANLATSAKQVILNKFYRSSIPNRTTVFKHPSRSLFC